MLRRIWNIVNFDHVMGGSIVFASGAMVYQAYSEGTFPLTKHISDKDARSDIRRLRLSPNQCRTLETAGYLVVDNFLTPEEVTKAANAARQIQSRSKDQVVFTGIRESTLAYFDASYIGATEGVPDSRKYHDTGAMLNVRHLMRGLAHSVRTSDFRGFASKPNSENDDGDRSFGVPDTLQLALYRANHAVANYNAAHRDGSSQSVWQTGLLGYLRSKYLRQRYLTCILYLNDNSDWETSDGGQLRIFENGDDDSLFADIEPRGGRLVLLSSESVLHAVQPSRRDRIACSIWFTRN